MEMLEQTNDTCSLGIFKSDGLLHTNTHFHMFNTSMWKENI